MSKINELTRERPNFVDDLNGQRESVHDSVNGYAHSATQCNQSTKSLDQENDIDWAPLHKGCQWEPWDMNRPKYVICCVAVDSKMIRGGTD